ncbi:MAG: HIT domain-containing protein [Chloroflexi bacterium]|nr:HIT domain-containing protein [Chloroflexota bacterium]MBT5627354.1 HIT domain-containing protein [Chloroflexota bacterium]
MSYELPDAGFEDCIFCSIVTGDAEASWESRPTGDSNVACFHNRLKWARVMLLIVPTKHLSQNDLWESDVLADAARLTVEMGDKHCGDEGYRAISNFGLQAHQSQTHGHIHVVSGTSRQIQSAQRISRLVDGDDVNIDQFEVEETPFAASISPINPGTQREMWQSGKILGASRAALDMTKKYSPDGFRLMSSFEPSTADNLAGENPASLFLLGGGQLGLYV